MMTDFVPKDAAGTTDADIIQHLTKKHGPGSYRVILVVGDYTNSQSFLNGRAKAEREISNRTQNAEVYVLYSWQRVAGAQIGGAVFRGSLSSCQELAKGEIASGKQRVEIIGPNGYKEIIK